MATIKHKKKPVLSQKSSLRVKDPDSQSWVFISGMVDFNGPQTSRGEIDVTDLESTAMEYLPDLKDNGTFTATMNTLLGDPGQQILMRSLDTSDLLEFELILPDDGFGNGEVPIYFNASVTQFPIEGAARAVLRTSLSLRISGDVTFPNDATVRLVFDKSVLNESYLNDGSVSGTVSVVLTGDTFTGTDGEEMAAVTFSGVPEGLTGKATKINSTTVVLSFAGQAAEHAADTSYTLTVTFQDAAFTSKPAAEVGSSNRSVTINFI